VAALNAAPQRTDWAGLLKKDVPRDPGATRTYLAPGTHNNDFGPDVLRQGWTARRQRRNADIGTGRASWISRQSPRCDQTVFAQLVDAIDEPDARRQVGLAGTADHILTPVRQVRLFARPAKIPWSFSVRNWSHCFDAGLSLVGIDRAAGTSHRRALAARTVAT